MEKEKKGERKKNTHIIAAQHKACQDFGVPVKLLGKALNWLGQNWDLN